MLRLAAAAAPAATIFQRRRPFSPSGSCWAAKNFQLSPSAGWRFRWRACTGRPIPTTTASPTAITESKNNINSTDNQCTNSNHNDIADKCTQQMKRPRLERHAWPKAWWRRFRNARASTKRKRIQWRPNGWDKPERNAIRILVTSVDAPVKDLKNVSKFFCFLRSTIWKKAFCFLPQILTGLFIRSCDRKSTKLAAPCLKTLTMLPVRLTLLHVSAANRFGEHLNSWLDSVGLQKRSTAFPCAGRSGPCRGYFMLLWPKK